jgi:hypothetical protein
MRSYRVVKAVKILVFIVLAVLVFGLVTMRLWNWLMPEIFGLTRISFGQAVGLVVLSKILFGGFHRHGGGGRTEWKRRMEQRWAEMSPEERERLRGGMRGRWGCKPSACGKSGEEQGSI